MLWFLWQLTSAVSYSCFLIFSEIKSGICHFHKSSFSYMLVLCLGLWILPLPTKSVDTSILKVRSPVYKLTTSNSPFSWLVPFLWPLLSSLHYSLYAVKAYKMELVQYANFRQFIFCVAFYFVTRERQAFSWLNTILKGNVGNAWLKTHFSLK